MSGRRLSLKREVLGELRDGDLRLVAAGAPPTRDCDVTLQTCYSCLTYISCNPAQCVRTLRDCAVIDPSAVSDPAC